MYRSQKEGQIGPGVKERERERGGWSEVDSLAKWQIDASPETGRYEAPA